MALRKTKLVSQLIAKFCIFVSEKNQISMKKNNFKACLLQFYWLMAQSDGEISFHSDDPEWKMLKKLLLIEHIPEEDALKFGSDFQKNIPQQQQELIGNLVILKHRERVRALAWMDLVMFADGILHDKELELFETVRSKFDIGKEEISTVKAQIIDEIGYSY